MPAVSGFDRVAFFKFRAVSQLIFAFTQVILNDAGVEIHRTRLSPKVKDRVAGVLIAVAAEVQLVKIPRLE